jgi:methyl-accepting chemotaxis protein
MAEGTGVPIVGKFLRDTKIRNKLLAGFLPCLFLLWIMAGYGIFTLTTLNTDIGDFGDLSDDVAAMADLQADTYRLRLEVNKYVRTGDKDLHDYIEKHFVEMHEALTLADKIITKPERAEKIDQVKTVIESYRLAFEEITRMNDLLTQTVEQEFDGPVKAGLEKLRALRADLNDIQRYEDAFTLTGQIESLLTIYHDVSDALRTQDAGVFAQSENATSSLASGVAAFADRMRSDSGKQSVAAIGADLAIIQAAIPKLQNTISEREAMVAEELDVVGPKVAALIRAVIESVDVDRVAVSEKTEGHISTANTFSLVLVVIGTLLTILFITVITSEVAGPVQAVARAMRDLAEGNRDVVIPGQDRKDESGRLAQAAVTFKVNAEEIERLSREESERKLLEAEAREARDREEKQRMETLAHESQMFGSTVGDIVEVLNEAAEEMGRTAKLMSEAVSRTGDESNHVVSACMEANKNVENVAAAAEELAVNVAEVGKQMTEASTLSKEASEQTEEANRLMDVLGSSAEEIDGVVQLIDRIVNQTQLLSLNATIEANRAGDAGKGFTVVAYEIKNLSEQTRNATQEIRDKVKNIQSNAQDSITSIRNISTVFQQVNDIVNMISSSMAEQDAATSEIARHALEAAGGTRDATDGLRQLAGEINKLGESSGTVLNASESLGDQSRTLRLSVREFIQKLTAEAS